MVLLVQCALLEAPAQTALAAPPGWFLQAFCRCRRVTDIAGPLSSIVVDCNRLQAIVNDCTRLQSFVASRSEAVGVRRRRPNGHAVTSRLGSRSRRPQHRRAEKAGGWHAGMSAGCGFPQPRGAHPTVCPCCVFNAGIADYPNAVAGSMPQAALSSILLDTDLLADV